jgi:hypothetical protein
MEDSGSSEVEGWVRGRRRGKPFPATLAPGLPGTSPAAEPGGATSFTDGQAIPALYRASVGALQSAGVMRGYPGGVSSPRPVAGSGRGGRDRRADRVAAGRAPPGGEEPFAVREVSASEWRLPAGTIAASGEQWRGTANLSRGHAVAGRLRVQGGPDVRYLRFGKAGTAVATWRAEGLPRWTHLASAFGRNALSVWDITPATSASLRRFPLTDGWLSLSESTAADRSVAVFCGRNGHRVTTTAQGWYSPRPLGAVPKGWRYVGPPMPLPVLATVLLARQGRR